MTLTEKYEELAGYKANVKALVDALHIIESGSMNNCNLTTIEDAINAEIKRLSGYIQDLDEEICQIESDNNIEAYQEFDRYEKHSDY